MENNDNTENSKHDANRFEKRDEVIDDFTVQQCFHESDTSWFHSKRFTKAFPGIRGSEEFSGPVAAQRLAILLEKPLKWIWEEKSKRSLGNCTPIWWWRGLSTMPIRRFELLGDSNILLDEDELNIKRLIAVNTRAYWSCFVYVECHPSPPTGLYKYPEGYIEEETRRNGPFFEEYAIYDGVKVTRAEYDDGAAIINGIPKRIDEAKLRGRFLSPYNFLIAPQHSPINNSSFDSQCAKLLNEILENPSAIEKLIEIITQLPRQEYRTR